ncbi:sodium:calcium antiporter [Halocatena pleomorpha]|uniref:Sodium:calcium antiporter n=1 Tax=Halocatena pleomorpha TaxID=1785090 RepID=A0A3P3RD96_9EURY|nr:sodium:calcium antiporter [Halocatena pleomorpha]RRJ31477.1 sodium:calcium antiporter [Halocatena pleomorpha]
MVVLRVVLFLGGIAILIYSVEELIENITKAAILSGVSAFLLAVFFTGLDFENWAFGVAAIVGDLPGVAIGSAFGSALFLVGVSVALAGVLVPFEPNLPTDYLLLLAVSPLLALPFLLDRQLSRTDGGFLLVIFGGVLAYLYWQEERGRETFRDEETEEARAALAADEHGPWYYIGFVVVFTIGMVIGSELAVYGARGILANVGLNGTIFGMTVVGFVMSLEEILLVVEPIRNDRSSIAVGNIIGSLIFFTTGNIGLLAVVRSFPVAQSVLWFYWPAVFVTTLLTAVVLYRGRIKRPEGVLFGVLYVAYWVISYAYLPRSPLPQ